MIFIDNKYTKWYNSIISQEKNRINIGYVEKHHIIPESFFAIRTRKGPCGIVEGNPEDANNLVA